MQPPDNETQITEHLQPSVAVILLRLLATLFLLDTVMALIIAGFFALNNVHEWHSAYIMFILLVHIVKYLLMTVVAVQLFANWASRAYYIHGHHLIEHLGLVNITETTYELSQIKSIVVHQSWLGRKFNFGTIQLSLAGGGETKGLTLRNITNPVRYKKYFDQHMQVQGWVR